MIYKQDEYEVGDKIAQVRSEAVDWEKKKKREHEEALYARLRILEALPPGLVLTGVQMSKFYGSEAIIHIQQDGDTDDVTQSISGLMQEMPPARIERVLASCAWMQPVGYRDERNKASYEAPSTKIIPVCPVWVDVKHVIKNHQAYVKFCWYTDLIEMIDHPDNGTYGDGPEITVRVEVEVLQPHNWVRYRCEITHGRGDSDITVKSQEVFNKFKAPVKLQIMGRGSHNSSWGYTVYWEENIKPGDAIVASEKWDTTSRRGY
jgi:hypothetical protein